jgi:hypothetical protein
VVDFFWFFSAAFWFAVLRLARSNPAPGLWTDRPSESEINRFRNRVAAYFCAPQLLLGLIQITHPHSTPFSRQHFSFNDSYWLLNSLVEISCWGALLWWLWFRNGHITLGRFAPTYNLPPKLKSIRWVLTALSLFSLVSWSLQ